MVCIALALGRSYSMDGAENTLEQLVEDARQALRCSAAEGDWEPQYHSIVQRLSLVHKNNEREMAQALQEIARRIMTLDGEPDAFAFKQRACEMLLRHNVEMRRLGRTTVQTEANPYIPEHLPFEILAKAREVSVHVDEQQSEHCIAQLIAMLEAFHANNQREVAASLQQLSKSLANEEESFRFKQRTCAAMLRLSVVQRRRKQRCNDFSTKNR